MTQRLTLWACLARRSAGGKGVTPDYQEGT
jgi:hypothetical protein